MSEQDNPQNARPLFRLRDRHFILIALVIQVLCATFFISDTLSSVIGLSSTPISWRMRELIEIGAGVGLVLGIVMGATALRRSRQRHQRAEAQLRLVSTAFRDLVEEAFDEWGLTPAERDVALFCIKGMTTQEIAVLRSTSEGTVKAQTNAIYRKAGVSGRSQLLSLFIEELMDDALLGADAQQEAIPAGDAMRPDTSALADGPARATGV
jgi:DNA-binding CsgD family transcriptional regulator